LLFDATTGGVSARVEVREIQGSYRVSIGGKTLDLDWVRTGEEGASLLVDGASHDVSFERTPDGFAVLVRGDRFDVELKDAVKGAVPGRGTPSGPVRGRSLPQCPGSSFGFL
jgi:hypothetical protein